MPSEPDNKMDDLLKAYAKKRRTEAGAPMEMHPATRRLLQAEAAKLRPSAAPAATSWLSALKMFWPRLAFAAGVLLMAGIAALTLLPTTNEKQEEMKFAKQDAAPLAVDRYAADERAVESRRTLSAVPAKPERESILALEDKVSAPTPARREAKALPELAVAEEKETSKKSKAVDIAQNEPRNNVALSRGAATAPTAPPAPVREPVALGVVAASEVEKLNRAAGALMTTPLAKLSADGLVEAVTAASQIDAVALRFKEEKALTQQQLNATTTRSRFANVQPASRQNLGRAATAYDTTVLANFVVEQDGNQLRMVDADGSVYDGKVLVAEPVAAGFETQLKVAAESRSDASSPARAQAGKDQRAQQPQGGPVAAASWNFRVSGTNRTLQQPVIVDGILFETGATNALGLGDVKTTADSLRSYQVAPGQAPAQQKTYGGAAASPATLAQNSAANSLSQSYNGQSMNLLNTRRIQGSVRVGATNQLPLDAVPDGNQR